jgi:hypothetical protein
LAVSQLAGPPPTPFPRDTLSPRMVGEVVAQQGNDLKALRSQTVLKGSSEPKGLFPRVTTTPPALAIRPVVIVASSTKSAGHFQAKLQYTDQVLVQKSRQPFLDAARVLVEKGYDPNVLLVMKHLGSDIIALRAPLGKAAKLTVEEGPHGPRFVAFRTGPRTSVAAPSIAPSVGSATNGSDERGQCSTVGCVEEQALAERRERDARPEATRSRKGKPAK